MLKKLRAIIVGGLALCCLYLFTLYLRTDGGELIKNTVSLADDAQETACPTEAAAATETLCRAPLRQLRLSYRRPYPAACP